MLREVEGLVFDRNGQSSGAKGFTLFDELGFGDRVKAHLVKKSQKPWLSCFELRILEELVPDGKCASHQLITAGRIHAINTHVHSADPYGSLGGESACRVVF